MSRSVVVRPHMLTGAEIGGQPIELADNETIVSIEEPGPFRIRAWIVAAVPPAEDRPIHHPDDPAGIVV